VLEERTSLLRSSKPVLEERTSLPPSIGDLRASRTSQCPFASSPTSRATRGAQADAVQATLRAGGRNILGAPERLLRPAPCVRPVPPRCRGAARIVLAAPP
jgi:hypothetical protein